MPKSLYEEINELQYLRAQLRKREEDVAARADARPLTAGRRTGNGFSSVESGRDLSGDRALCRCANADGASRRIPPPPRRWIAGYSPTARKADIRAHGR